MAAAKLFLPVAAAPRHLGSGQTAMAALCLQAMAV